MTPGIFVVPSIISTKPVKLGTLNLVHIFVLVLPTRMEYNILKMRRGLGHVTRGIFVIPSIISTKPVKLQTSNLVHIFDLILLTKMGYNILEIKRGYVT